MSSSNISTATAIADMHKNWSFCLFTLGLIGHSLNIYVFTRPKFRSNSCVRYCLASTFSGYIVVCLSISLRLLQISYQIDFIILASIDRYFSSSFSVALRQWSSTRVAFHVIPLTILLIALIYLHIPFYYTIVLPQRTCTFGTSSYQAFFALFNMIIWSWIPTTCMLIFGLLILRNTYQMRRRVAPLSNTSQRRTDRQLIRMLFFQSFVLCSMTTTLAISSLYISIKNSVKVKTDLDKTKDR